MLRQTKTSEIISVDTVMINGLPVVVTTHSTDEFVDDETGDEWLWTGREYINLTEEGLSPKFSNLIKTK